MPKNPYHAPDVPLREGAERGQVDTYGLVGFWYLIAQGAVIVLLLVVVPVYHGPSPPPRAHLVRQLLGAACLVELVLAPLVLLTLGLLSLSRFSQQRKHRLCGVVSLGAGTIGVALIAIMLLFAKQI